jgi:CHAD domain-containing protein
VGSGAGAGGEPKVGASRKSPAGGQGSRAVLEKKLRKLRREMERVARDPDVDAVHDVRVAVRRMVQAVRFSAGTEGAGAAKKLARRLRRVRRRAGPVRDRDVIHALLAGEGLRLADPAMAFLRGERRMAGASLSAWMRRRLQQDVCAKWAGALGKISAGEAKEDWEGLVRAFFAAGHAAAATGEAAALHELRIAAKRVRYTLEMLSPKARRLAALRALQDVLGWIQDTVVAEEYLHGLDALTSAARKALGRVRQRRAKLIGEFQEKWALEFAGDAGARWQLKPGARKR